MNEEELKDLWRAAGESAPAIDFGFIEKSADEWKKNLRRKVRVDVTIQIIAGAAGIIANIFYPWLIFFNLLMIPIGIWYVRALRGLHHTDNAAVDLPVRNLLESKIKTFDKFFRQTRFAVYVMNLFAVHAFLYGAGFYERVSNSPDHPWTLIRAIGLLTVSYEVAAVIANEVYFKLIYKPAYRQLRDLCDQLRSAG